MQTNRPKKAIIMIGGGIQEVSAVTRLQEIGYTAIVTDRNPDAPAFSKADIKVHFDARDIQGICSWILSFKKEYNIAGIFTLTSQAPSVALIANATGLPSLPVDIILDCDNKLLMKRRFQEQNLPTAKVYEVQNHSEVDEYLKKYPGKSFYLKTVDGFGGKGIKQIKGTDSSAEIFSTISDYSSFPILLLEESLVGDFIDVQGVFYDDQFYPAGTADSYFSNTIEEYAGFNPVEIYNISPSQKSPEIIADAYRLLESASRKMGMTWGAVSGDFILTLDGLKIIEIGPRLHGPNGTLRIFPESTGIKPFEFMAQCIAGDIPEKSLLKEKYQKVALCQVFISTNKVINEVGFKNDPIKLPGLFAWNIYHGYPTTNKKSETTLSGLASAFVVGETYKVAVQNLDRVKKNFYIK